MPIDACLFSPVKFKTGDEPIGNGASSLTVTFSEEFNAAPTVTPILVKPDDGSPNLFLVNITAPTATGFTAYFSAMTDSADYRLHYSAVGL